MSLNRRSITALLVAVLFSLLLMPCAAWADKTSAEQAQYPDEMSMAEDRLLQQELGDAGVSLLSADDLQAALAGRTGKDIIVALDAGHGTDPETGAYDSGAIGVYGAAEATYNQRIADVCQMVLNKYDGVTAIMVPQYRSVKQRVDWAASQGASLYISLHNNSGGAGGHGAEIWIPNSSSYNHFVYETASSLASKVQAKFEAMDVYYRGTFTRDCTDGETYEDGMTADYYSANYQARQYGICGIIIEHAFVSNSLDTMFLDNDANLVALGTADAQAIYEQIQEGIGGLPKPVSEEDVRNFVKRLYENVMERTPDEEGMNAQVQAMMNGAAAAQIAYNFFNSVEFANRSLTYAQAVEIAYTTMLNRPSDAEGSAMWQGYLQHGCSICSIVAGFAQSQEFNALCDGWGVTCGTVSPDQPRDKNPQMTSFIYRLYNNVLERTPEVQGLNDQCSGMQAGMTASVIADNFFTSDEFTARNLSNQDIVTIAYSTMLDRQPDADGQKYWVSRMDEGLTVRGLISGFVESVEFTNLCQQYGVERGDPVALNDAKGQQTNNVPAEEVANVDPNSEIMGESDAALYDAMVAYYVAYAGISAYPGKVYTEAPTIQDFCRIVYEEATAEGVKADIVFCQAMHETGWLKFGGDVSVEQRNFAGIGATGNGAKGNSFKDVREGIRAQVQHLKAYASTDALVNPCVDPRFNLVKRGSATNVYALGGKWAAGNGYGEAIMKYDNKLKTYL